MWLCRRYYWEIYARFQWIRLIFPSGAYLTGGREAERREMSPAGGGDETIKSSRGRKGAPLVINRKYVGNIDQVPDLQGIWQK
jgi:hypothetical protein